MTHGSANIHELINYGIERFAEKHRNDRSYFREVTAEPGQLAVSVVDEFKRQKKLYNKKQCCIIVN